MAERPPDARLRDSIVVDRAYRRASSRRSKPTYLSVARRKTCENLSKAYASDAGWTKVENLSDYNVSPSDSSTTLTAAYKSAAEGKDVYIYTTSAKGYKSGLELMIVVENDKIIKIMKTSSSETMGVESKESFLNQFYNVDLTTIDGFRTNKQKR